MQSPDRQVLTVAFLQKEEVSMIWIDGFVFEKNESLAKVLRHSAGYVRQNSANASPVHRIQDKKNTKFVFHGRIMCSISAIKKIMVSVLRQTKDNNTFPKNSLGLFRNVEAQRPRAVGFQGKALSIISMSGSQVR
jgi:hypothetical protein